jgi:hypothetical protein
MTERRFLDDAELESVMNNLPDLNDLLPVGLLDQFDAATRDAAGMSFGMVAAAATRGDRAFLCTFPDDLALRRRMVRPRLKMMLAAFSAGPTRLCAHTNQVRPMLLSCDPPSLVCMDRACIAKVVQHAQTAGYRWDHQCDLCGRRTKLVFPYLTTLGPLSINGHLCEPCTGEMTRGSAQVSADFPTVARTSPCPCGSGRRYKACHGRAR